MTINSATIDRAVNPAEIVRSAQSQWFSRPDDEKYASLDSLYAAVAARRTTTAEYETDISKFSFKVLDGEIVTSALVPYKHSELEVIGKPTHYAFGQTAALIGAPAGYFRDKLADRPDIVASALNHGIAKRGAEGVKLLTAESADLDRVLAVTSPTYGRIWDADVVAATKRIIDATNGEFYAPLDWGKEKRALFASDRDVFMFFINGGSIVDGGGERDQLNRGFFVWNSEVGSKTMGIASFLFRIVCGNFGIFGAQDVRLLKIRHTSGGPERFVTDAIPALDEMVNASVKPIEDLVRQAKAKLLPASDKIEAEYLKRGFTKSELNKAKILAEAEEGQFATEWDLYNGLTAAARTLAYAESRVDLSKRAGALLDALAG